MASIDSMTFDEAAYNPGDLITLTVGYTPDTPAVVPTTFNATASITDSGGNVVAPRGPVRDQRGPGGG